MTGLKDGAFERISDFKWSIPKTYKQGMRVGGIIYADAKMLGQIKMDKAVEQVANVAFLPGIVDYSIAMPDIHWGYGFCIGGVAATDPDNGGVISPGGVGFDINCGVRLLKTDLILEDVKDKISAIISALFRDVPAGVGSEGSIKLSDAEQRKMLIKGAKWAVEKGFGVAEDLKHCEEQGAIEGANPDTVSDRAYKRGTQQAGTLGSGNHFLEVQVIEEIFDGKAANIMGLHKDQITIMIHTGSRGFGYQVCDDYIRVMLGCLHKYNIHVPDRQLACAPLNSEEAKNYIAAMKAAANYAWNNRQVLTHLVRKSLEKIFNKSYNSLGLDLVYDVAHNIAKFEKYTINGKEKTLCVHRKGATRAFGPGNINIPETYSEIGQPVIIPGDMGRASFVLVGTKKAEEETFSSTCHGAGRLKSRTEAINTINFSSLMSELRTKGIEVRATGKQTLVEEAPSAYKDVNEVVNIVHNAGISKKVCRMRPLGVIKG